MAPTPVPIRIAPPTSTQYQPAVTPRSSNAAPQAETGGPTTMMNRRPYRVLSRPNRLVPSAWPSAPAASGSPASMVEPLSERAATVATVRVATKASQARTAPEHST